VGANLGVFSLYAAKMGFQVIAIEATEINIARFQESAAVNKLNNIKIHKAAITDSNGCLPMAVGWRKGNYGMNSLRFPSNKAEPEKYEMVTATTLVDIVPPDAKISLMKMDIEGAEVDALRGAKPLFQRRQIERIFIEVNVGRLAQFDRVPADVRALLEAYCFDVSRFPNIEHGARDFTTKLLPDCQVA